MGKIIPKIQKMEIDENALMVNENGIVVEKKLCEYCGQEKNSCECRGCGNHSLK